MRGQVHYVSRDQELLKVFFFPENIHVLIIKNEMVQKNKNTAYSKMYNIQNSCELDIIWDIIGNIQVTVAMLTTVLGEECK